MVVGLTGIFEDIYHIPSEMPEGYGWEIELSRSSYGSFLSSGTILVALCCTFSSSSRSPLVTGHHTEFAYSMWGRTMVLYNSGRFSLSRYLKVLRIRPSRELALEDDLDVWWEKESLSIQTLRSFSTVEVLSGSLVPSLLDMKYWLCGAVFLFWRTLHFCMGAKISKRYFFYSFGPTSTKIYD